MLGWPGIAAVGGVYWRGDDVFREWQQGGTVLRNACGLHITHCWNTQDFRNCTVVVNPERNVNFNARSAINSRDSVS